MPRAALAGAIALVVLAATARASAACTPDEATAAYTEAHRAFEEKRYDDSVALLRRAYACDANPVYLANVARAYEEANRPKEAVAAWREYLRTVKDPDEQRRTEGRISVLTKAVEEIDRLERERQAAEAARLQAEQDARLAAASTTPSKPETPPSKHVALGAWIVTGVGAAGLLAGVVLGIDALATHSSAQKDPVYDTAQKTQNDAVNLAHDANWAFAIGGAIAAAGVTWIAIDLLRPAPTAPPVSVIARGNGIALVAPFE